MRYLLLSERDQDELVAAAELAALPTCRVCGCNELHACAGGCYWVEEDLCSSCVGHEDQARTVRGRAAYAGRHGRGWN